MTPERPPIVNCETRPTAKSIGVVKFNEPPNIVPIQLKIFTPVGIAISIVLPAKTAFGGRAEAGGEHVVDPDAEAEEGDRGDGVDHDRVAEERLAREDRDDLGDDAEGRQDQDVDLRVAEDPEEVLPEQRIAAGGHADDRSRCQRSGPSQIRIRAMVMAGKAMTIRMEVISVDQVKIGMRIMVMPGARMLMIVTMKLNAAAIDATPSTWRPSIQKSTLRPGFQACSVSGA